MARQMLLVSTIYILVGAYGYLTFGSDFNDEDQNILTKYNSKNISILIVDISLTSGYILVDLVNHQCTAIQRHAY